MKIIFRNILMIAIGFIAFECFLQVTFHTRPTLTMYDPDFGTRNKFDFTWVKFKEGFYIGKTNELGLIHEVTLPESIKGRRRLKIGLVGDSFVAGDDVFDRYHFGNILERKLNQNQDSVLYDVINLGRGNFSLPSSYYFFNKMDSIYSFDFIYYFLEARDYDIYNPRYIKYYSLKDGNLKENLDGPGDFQFDLYRKIHESKLDVIFNNLCFPALLSRTLYSVQTIGLKEKVFDKFISIDKLLNLNESKELSIWEKPISIDKEELPEISKFILNDLRNKFNNKIKFVVRQHPLKVPQYEVYLKNEKFSFISLSEIFDGGQTIRDGLDAHWFKATSSYGGHFNHIGHKAVADFLYADFATTVK